MLTRLDKTRRMLAGKNESIDILLDARHALLVDFVGLISGKGNRKKCLPNTQQLQAFSQLLVDYVSAGHFDIYHHVVSAIERASGRQLSIVNRILPRIQQTTEQILAFHDQYVDIQPDDDAWLSLDEDLNQLGHALEERFRLEDRLVMALRVLDEMLEES